MPTRRRSPLDHDQIDAAVDDMLKKGIISPYKSKWVSEPHLVCKDDGSYLFCVDFRPVNVVTIHNRYPLSHVDDLLDQSDAGIAWQHFPMNGQHYIFRSDNNESFVALP